jgi:hypothetical protein
VFHELKHWLLLEVEVVGGLETEVMLTRQHGEVAEVAAV